MPQQEHYRVVIVGGGSAGIAIAARLCKSQIPPSDIAIIEPSDKHYYQPLWTLVGGGVFPREKSERSEAGLIPRGAVWIRDAVVEFRPEVNQLRTRDGKTIGYDWLVVALGIQVYWNKIPGLQAAIGKDGVCSNYSYDTCEATWEAIRGFRGGTALFTMPSGPIKCGGAPQKIMYLADDTFRRNNIRNQSQVLYATALDRMFQVDKYCKTLDRVVQRRGIEPRFRRELIELRAARKEAVFQHLDTGAVETIHYDMIHVTPPMGPFEFVKQSPLAAADGFIEVDKHSLRHIRYLNVFAAGDCSSLPTSKTGAAIRRQVPVLVAQLQAAMAGAAATARYNGYTSCPLITGYGKLVLAEFDYDKNPTETFPFDQAKERWSMYLLKAYVLPVMYWKLMLKGKM